MATPEKDALLRTAFGEGMMVILSDWRRMSDNTILVPVMMDGYILAFLTYSFYKYLNKQISDPPDFKLNTEILRNIIALRFRFLRHIRRNPNVQKIIGTASHFVEYFRKDEQVLAHVKMISLDFLDALKIADVLFAKLQSGVHKMPNPDSWLDSCHVYCPLWKNHKHLLTKSTDKMYADYADHMCSMCSDKLVASMAAFKKKNRLMGFLFAEYEVRYCSSEIVNS